MRSMSSRAGSFEVVKPSRCGSGTARFCFAGDGGQQSGFPPVLPFQSGYNPGHRRPPPVGGKLTRWVRTPRCPRDPTERTPMRHSLAAALLSVCAGPVAAADAPNVVYILADDFG